jgi:hypothetical protein
MSSLLTPNSVVAAARNQVSCDVGGESAILNLDNGVYYSLNPIGARVWKLIEQPRRIEEIREVLLEEYDVEPGPCENDLLALLARLLEQGLIELRPSEG